jgi:hypothetical protein
MYLVLSVREAYEHVSNFLSQMIPYVRVIVTFLWILHFTFSF